MFYHTGLHVGELVAVVDLAMEPDDGLFAKARTHLDEAKRDRAALARCWVEICEAKGFDSNLVIEAGQGRLDVIAEWPRDSLVRANEAANRFASNLRLACDDAILAGAHHVSGAVIDLDPASHRMLFCTSEDEFAAAVAGGALAGLRPDQIRGVSKFQPFRDAPGESELRSELRKQMAHLSEMLNPARPPDRPRVAVWVHSARPRIEVPSGVIVPCASTGDGVLVDVRTVATFVYDGDSADLLGNPNLAFDMIFNDPPWPEDPDDNLPARSAMMLASAREFVRAMERSVALRPPVHASPRRMASVIRPLAGTEWTPLDLDAFPDGQVVEAAMASSDLGLAIHSDGDGQVTMLVRSGETTFCRPVPAALPLDPAITQGTAAEDASLDAASRWGLPDFVMRPSVIAKGKASREVGDGTIIAGRRGVSVQVKSREAAGDDPSREERWIAKQVAAGARQARGTVRSLRAGPVQLVNGRGRALRCDGRAIDWVGVVIIDHPQPPEVTVPVEASDLPMVVLLRRDWEFLFDQLRSVSAVIDYLHRVAAKDPRPLGREAIRYYELAQADEDAAGPPPPWAAKFGLISISRPLLPKAPASAEDNVGHTVFRIILEEIASTDVDEDEWRRLEVLALVDRFSIGERAGLGRLLLNHLDSVRTAEPGTTMWQFRRVVQDEGRLHLAFGACNQFTEFHQEAFKRWAMLRHHELTEARIIDDPSALRSVAVLLTPRHDGFRPWDTTMIAIEGDLELDAEDVAALRAVWDRAERL